MKKNLLFALALAASLGSVNAQDTKEVTWKDGSVHTVKPIVTMTTTTGAEAARSFYFGSYKDLDFYAVDWGDGNLVLTDSVKSTNTAITTAQITGNALGDGNITIYAEDNDIWYFSTSLGDTITSIDLSNLNKVQTLSIGNAKMETVDLSKCDSLRSFSSFNGILTALDFSNCKELTTVSAAQNQIAELNISNCPKLNTLQIYSNKLTSLDLSNNPAIETVAAYSNEIASFNAGDATSLKLLNLGTNKLSSIDLSKLTALKNLYLSNNELTELDVPVDLQNFEAENNKIAKITVMDCTKSCKLANNCLTLATLPVKPASLNTKSKIKKFTYAPQADFSLADSLCTYAKSDDGATKTYIYDLSAEDNAIGIESEAKASTFTWYAGETALTEGTDYSLENDVFTFLKAQSDSVYVTVASEAFPLFTGDNILKSEKMTISGGEMIPIVKATATVDGETEVYFNFGTYRDNDTYLVDWGDGNLVKSDSIFKNNSKLTKVAGIPAGEGNIAVYADNDDAWYIGMGGAKMVTSIDLSNAPKVQQVNISNASMETVDVSSLDSLRSLSIFKSDITSLDVSKNTLLTSLSANQNALTSIDLSNNTNLETLQLMKNQIETLDLTNNTKLSGYALYANDNGLKTLTLGENNITLANLADNELTEFDAAKTPEMKTLYLTNNKISEIDYSAMPNLSDLYVSGNELTELVLTNKMANLEAENNKIAKVSIVDCTKSCKLANNCLSIATLPAKPESLNTKSKIKKFTYAPQAALEVEAEYVADSSTDTDLDLSAQSTATGVLTEAVSTTFAFVTAEGDTLVAGTDYTEAAAGCFIFNKVQSSAVHGVMTTEAFPLATGDNAFVTTEFNIVETSTGIENVENAVEVGKIYNLNGMMVKNAAKGVYIKNGKKYIAK